VQMILAMSTVAHVKIMLCSLQCGIIVINVREIYHFVSSYVALSDPSNMYRKVSLRLMEMAVSTSPYTNPSCKFTSTI